MRRLLISGLLTSLLLHSSLGLVFADYQLTQLGVVEWSGTTADRLQKEAAGSYQFNYGDEATVSFTLPWDFTFYEIPYSQITADTDGSIWFGSYTVVNSYDLASTGPVLSAWNNDLSSYAFGGVFVQHKTGPERIVVEWQTETFLDQGFHRPNNFEVVLYPDGKIKLNYKSFAMEQGQDSGSGISSGDGLNFINLSASYGDVQTLAGKSFLIEDIGQQTNTLLEVFFAGNGEGTVVSSPSGLDCDTDCSAQFPIGTEITLSASSLSDSSFTGWTNGSCSGTADCVLTLNADTAVTANFTIINIPFDVLLETTQGTYTTIQSAYDSIPSDLFDTIKIKAGDQAPGDLMFDRNVTVRLEGGYDDIFENVVSDTSFFGTLTISGNPVTVSDLIIK